ncbi:MAG: hypothetical protein RL038_507 [Actinomycetota bacterium]
MSFADRIERLRAALPDVDGFVSIHFPTVRYLTGFSGSNGSVLVTRHSVTLFTDGRYITQAEQEAVFDELSIERNVLSAAVNKATDLSSVAFEAEHVSASDYLEFFGDEKWIPTRAVVEQLRAVKDQSEVDALARACEITSIALENIFAGNLIGRSEIEIAADLEHEFLKLGAENRAFDSIVASGPNSAIPHHQPTKRPITNGDFLKIDCGARFAGYHADLTRTVVVGRAADWQREIYSVVAEAAAKTRAAAIAGVDVFDLDTIARDSITTAGYGEFFLHPTGHGVGLEIHELPFLGRKDGILRPQMLITVEPGVYLANRGGVRIEDTLLITETGHKNLTTVTRELQEL